jgi:hypothetical protein
MTTSDCGSRTADVNLPGSCCARSSKGGLLSLALQTPQHAACMLIRVLRAFSRRWYGGPWRPASPVDSGARTWGVIRDQDRHWLLATLHCLLVAVTLSSRTHPDTRSAHPCMIQHLLFYNRLAPTREPWPHTVSLLYHERSLLPTLAPPLPVPAPDACPKVTPWASPRSC